MTKIFSNKVLIVLALLAALAVAAIFQLPDKNLHIYFLDIGQGDSAYVRTMNNFDVLVDGGPDKTVLSELGKVMPFWDRKIDLVILTHPHADHVSGLIDVLKRYKVEEIIITDAVHSTAEYLEFINITKDKNIHTTNVKDINEMIVDKDVVLNFYWPKESYKDVEVENLNNTSVVFKLTYGKFSALFTGDIEKDAHQLFLSEALANENILKVPHHGSNNGLSNEMLRIVNPNVAVISVGKNNKFDHPGKTTLDKLEKAGVKTLRTDYNGTIEIISNGQTFWLAPTSPE